MTPEPLLQAVVEVGSGISAVGGHLDRLNDNLSRGLHIGSGARGPERSQPSLTNVFESARTGSLPMPAPEEDDDSAYSDVPARCAALTTQRFAQMPHVCSSPQCRCMVSPAV